MLERTQPGMPLGILFAALNYLEGKLITTIAEQLRHQEWLAKQQATA